MGIKARQTVEEDIPELNVLLREILQRKIDAGLLLDATLLCLTALDKENGNIVGFLCLRDVPCTRLGSEAPPDVSQAWLQSLPTTQHNQSSTAYVSLCCVRSQYEVEGSGCLFRTAQMVAGHLRRYLMATSTDITFMEPGLATLFSRVTASNEANTVLYEAPSYVVLPPLTVRQARVEDHDEMLPVLERASIRYPALSQLPQSSRPEEAFALARVVATQDECNCVLVAHDLEAPGQPSQEASVEETAGGGMRLAGFMVATSEVDTTPLMDAFDLHPYDNLLPQEEYERQYEVARKTVREKKMEALMARLGDRLKPKSKPRQPSHQSSKASRPSVGSDTQMSSDQQQQQQQQSGAPSEQGPQQATPDKEGEEGGQGRVDAGVNATDEGQGGKEGVGEEKEEGGDEEETVTQADLDAAAEPSEEEVQAEMAYMFSYADEMNAQPSVFAITMACLDELYEPQAWNFLQEAFDAFPDKQYCVLTLPHDSPEPPLVSSFTRLDPLPGNSFPEVLYLINRHALIEGFEVRRAEEADAEGVSMLVSGMPNSAHVQDLFRNAQARGTAVVASVQGEVVGLATVSTSVDLVMLKANFSLSHLVNLPDQMSSEHAEIDMVCLNPIFAHRARELLSGVHRILKKTVLYYALPPGQAIPDTLDVMQQVPPRHVDPPAELEAEFALYMFSRKSAFLKRQCVNAQVVVVGASETGLAAVERMLLHPRLHLNFITLLAPGGIQMGDLASQYTKSIIARLGLQARVSVLNAEMVGLDRAERVIALNDGAQLNYDFLLITCGLQEPTASFFAQRDPEVAGNVCGTQELTSDFMFGDSLTMERIVLYGSTLDAIQAWSVLELRGGMSRLYSFCAPPAPPDPMVQVLQAAAEKLHIELPEPQPARLRALEFTDENDAKPMASFEEGSPVADSHVDLVIGCQQKQVPTSIFTALNDSGVVFDGRIVVDCAMCSSDPNIYAAGSCAKLSRRYGDNVLLQGYNARALGTALGESVLVRCTSIAQHEGDTAELPNVLSILQSFPSKVIGCQVPSPIANTFMFSGCPRAHQSPSLQPPAGGRALVTISERGFMQLTLDAGGTLYSAVLLGQVPIGTHKMAALAGLHVSYYNDLVAKFDAGEVPCLIHYITNEPWASLMHHDEFPQLRQQLALGSMQELAGGATPADILAAAARASYHFISHHHLDFPRLMAYSTKTVRSEQAAEQFGREQTAALS